MKNLPLDALRTFVAVCDAGSVTIAADHIGLSQPATSLQIKRLEELLETKLFLRIKKRLEPSEAGLKLYPKARQMLTLGDEILNEFRQPELQGHVCLGLPSEFATSLLPAILGRFSNSYPNVALEGASYSLFDLAKFPHGHFPSSLGPSSMQLISIECNSAFGTPSKNFLYVS